MNARTLTLCYHSISDTWDDAVAVRSGDFERQLAWTVSAGLQAGTLTAMVRGAPGAPTLAITFDDAFRSVYDLAYPLMQHLGLVGVVFVPTSFPSSGRRLSWPGYDSTQPPPPPEEMEPMSWDQLGELQDAGWEIGSHTRRHAWLPDLSDVELTEELADSRTDLRTALGTSCGSVAYPYGATDARVRAAAAAAGYSVGAALVRGLAPVQALNWPRVGVYRHDGRLRFRLKASRVVAGRAGTATVLGAQALGRAASAARRDASAGQR